MLVVLLAPPGSGKGTQVKFLQERHGFSALSGSGVLLEAKNDPVLRLIMEEVEKLQVKGNLVPDRTMNDLMVHFSIKVPPKQPLVLDGFPRTSGQIRGLQQICSRRLFTPTLSDEKLFVICFEGVGLKQAWQWVEEGRKNGLRPPRADDTFSTFERRHEIYQNELLDIPSKLSKSRMFRVDAARPKEDVYCQICNILGLEEHSSTSKCNPYPVYPDSEGDTVYHSRDLIASTTVEQPEPGCGA